jgi:predicted dinucleotide-binding enzyme
MASSTKPILGIIGAGSLGTALARQAITAGYAVNIGNSRGPESLGLVLTVLLPGAVALSVQEVAQKSDLIILAMPLNKYSMLPRKLFVGKIIVDAMNYWPPTEGEIPEFMNADVTSSEYLQRYFKGSRVVKTLNHVAYNEIEEHSLPYGQPTRRAIALAGDDSDAKKKVAQLIDTLGFDPIDLGGIRQGYKFQPDTQLFNARLTKDQIKQLAAATR